MAYKLKLSVTSNVHPVFHVSLRKKVTCMVPTSVSTLPSDVSTMRRPEMVLDDRLKNKNNRVIKQLLIKWSGMPVEMATWEDEDVVRHMLPSTSACGQAKKSGGGML